MDLDKLWEWDRKKLVCRIRPETGNPAEDDLREQLAELAGVNLQELLSEMKQDKKKKKDPKFGVTLDLGGDKRFKDVLQRSHILGASEIALKTLHEHDQAEPKSKRNIYKRFITAPKSPPSRILLDIQRERAKPLRLPDQDEGNKATSKLEKKLAKQRAARMAAKDEASKDDDSQKFANDGQPNFNTMATILQGYTGDKFGTAGDYMEGMLYLSRMPGAASRLKNKKFALSNFGDDESKSSDATLLESSGNDMNSIDDQSLHDDATIAEELSSKLYCAAALCNWSRNPSNAIRLANEGAVRAIMQLSTEKVPRIIMYCAGAFRYMSEHIILATAIIEEKVIPQISEIITNTSDEFVCGNLTICLLNLTRVNGKEGQLVEDGIVLSFMTLIQQRPELHAACCRGLYNLTCVDSSYALIDKVIRALVTLSSTGTASVKHICAAALCNLADLKQVRLRMVEEGVISILSVLARGSEARTRRVCAVILQNLTANKACRAEMVTRNCVQAAYGLSSDQDPIILRCIGLALSRLALEPVNCNRIINDGGILALCNISVKYPTISAISQPAAVAFQLLSSRPTVRITIVQEGSVAAIASLLRMSTDLYTLQYALLALCNLLSAPENHLPIVQQGMVATLTTLSANDDVSIRDYCALAVFNLSCAEESRKHVVNAGAIASIIALSKHEAAPTKRRCAASLCNLSTYETGMNRMVSDGIIPALVELITCDDVETVRYSCAALCRLCATVENGRLILESGAVPRVVQGAIEGDTVTKQFCAAVLSSLSFYETCRGTLCDLGIFSALKSLSNLNDDITKQRCLIAFANLSCDDSVQVTMVEQGVVGIISELANSYQETNQICCAMALCNLACCSEMRLRVATEGGMQALMMISMVRSVDINTKLYCVRAMANLLDDTTVTYLIAEGILGSVANLCKLPDNQVVNLCAKLFNQLTTYPQGRLQFIERPTTLSSMFTLFETTDVDIETRVICARSTSNMVITPSSRQKAIDYGALDVLEQGAQLEDEGASLHCLRAAFSSCSNREFRMKMAKSLLPVSFLQVASDCISEEKFLYCVKVVSILAWFDESRQFLISNDFITLMVRLIEKNPAAVQTNLVARTLCYVCLGYREQVELLDIGILTCVHTLCQTRNPVIMGCAAAILRNLSCDDRCIPQLASMNTIYDLKQITDICKSEETMYNIAVTLYSFAKYNQESRFKVLSQELLELLDDSAVNCPAADVIGAALAFFCTDHKTRQIFANPTVAKLTVRVIEFNPGEDTQSNVVSAIYNLSRIPSCREQLVAAGVDRLLLKLSQGDSPKVKANCSRALKNLSSDASETIEEGAVAALIAMSLEGKNRAKSGDELDLPDIIRVNFKSYGPPECLNDEVNEECWRDQSDRVKGGAAGRGPPPPEVPVMATESATNIPLCNVEEVESTNETDGKTKMAFAKMLVPSDLRDCFLFTDRDFDVQDDNTDNSSAILPNDDDDFEDDEVEILDSNHHAYIKPDTAESQKPNTGRSQSSQSQASQRRDLGSSHSDVSEESRDSARAPSPKRSGRKTPKSGPESSTNVAMTKLEPVVKKNTKKKQGTTTVSDQAANMKLYS